MVVVVVVVELFPSYLFTMGEFNFMLSYCLSTQFPIALCSRICIEFLKFHKRKEEGERETVHVPVREMVRGRNHMA